MILPLYSWWIALDSAAMDIKIGKKFGKRASSYDHNALFQQQVSDRLARRLQHMALPFAPRILEIGAGTGGLTRKLQMLWPQGEFVVTDLSLDMMRHAQKFQPMARRYDRFVVMAAEMPAVKPCFDLIVSSMCLHWTQNPVDTIKKISTLLNPGGVLAFSMLARDSFKLWRKACATVGVPCGLWDYPTLEEVKSIQNMMAISESLNFFFDSAEDFLYHLKSIGAASPRQGYEAQSSRVMRQVLRIANQTKPFVMNYDLIFGAYHAALGPADFTNI